MPLPDPIYESAKGVFQLPEPSLRRPDDDEPLIAAVRDEFPVLTTRQVLPPDSPFAVPYLAMNSSTGSSRLAVSAIGAEFDVRFYDEFSGNRERCFGYLRAKLGAAMAGWDALDLRPAFFGLVVTVNFPFGEDGEGPGTYLLRHHTRYDVSEDDLQDTQLRLGVKLDETYFLTLTTQNYETKQIERAVLPGARSMQVKPWEGTVVGTGIQLAVDVNNRLQAIQTREDPVVDGDRVADIVDISERVLAGAGRAFVEEGTLDLGNVIAEQT